MKTMLGRLVPLLLIALVGVVFWWHADAPSPGEVQAQNCADLRRGCDIGLGGRVLRVVVSGELKPLQAFQLRVAVPGANKVTARFTMEGMDMGFNLYTLRPDADGAFQARVTLPVCVTGRRDWVLHLDIDGSLVAVPFVTDL